MSMASSKQASHDIDMVDESTTIARLVTPSDHNSYSL